jgi:hypothetical protein
LKIFQYLETYTCIINEVSMVFPVEGSLGTLHISSCFTDAGQGKDKGREMAHGKQEINCGVDARKGLDSRHTNSRSFTTVNL